jgi:hypothetical protein
MRRRWGNAHDLEGACKAKASTRPDEQTYLAKVDLRETHKLDSAASSNSHSSGCIGKRQRSNSFVGSPSKAQCFFIEKGVRHNVTLATDSPLPLVELSDQVIEYQALLRAHYFRQIGMSKEEVASRLGRTLGWVTKCWRSSAQEARRPREIPPYVAEYELHLLKYRVEPFLPPVLKRKYVTSTSGLYRECVDQMPWRQAVFRKRNYETGEVIVTNIASNRQDCSYRGLRTGIQRLDEALQKLKTDFQIKDPRAYLLNNWYPDGKTSIAPHNHDFWSAILSFGESRVFMLDGQPLMLGDGDLLVFGTQRHSVPKMPEVSEGRVSVAVFWYPERREDRCAECDRPAELLQEASDGRSYCERCWLRTQASSDADLLIEDSSLAAEEDMLAAALQLSLIDQ